METQQERIRKKRKVGKRNPWKRKDNLKGFLSRLSILKGNAKDVLVKLRIWKNPIH
jgi:hypothetical protein